MVKNWGHISLLLVILLVSCQKEQTLERPVLPSSRSNTAVIDSSSESFIIFQVEEVEILGSRGELFGDREFRLLVVAAVHSQGSQTSSLTCPADKPIRVRVGDKITTQDCPFSISVRERDIEDDLFLLVVGVDEDKMNGAARFGIDVLLNIIAQGIGAAVKGFPVVAVAATDPLIVGGVLLLESAVGFAGNKLVDFGLSEDDIGALAVRLSSEDDWFVGKRYTTRTEDGNLEITFSVYRSDAPPSVTPRPITTTPRPSVTPRPVTTTPRPSVTPRPVTTTPKPSATPTSPVVALVLVNADSNKDIVSLKNGDRLALSSLPTSHLNIRAAVSSSAMTRIESIVFYLNDTRFCMNDDNRCVENATPYAMAGDVNGNYYNNWDWRSLLGTNTIKAVPCRKDGGRGICETPLVITFTVVNR